MKNYVVRKDEDFILGYTEEERYLRAKHANGIEDVYNNLKKNKDYLDNEMMNQYKSYNYNPSVFLSHKDLTTVLPIILGSGVGFTITDALLNKGIPLEDLLISGATFSGIALITLAVLGGVRAEKSERDHQKDTLFIDNLEIIKEMLKDSEFCKNLPRGVRKKVIGIKEAGEQLTLNAANNFNLKQMEKLVSACQKEKAKVRTR